MQNKKKGMTLKEFRAISERNAKEQGLNDAKSYFLFLMQNPSKNG